MNARTAEAKGAHPGGFCGGREAEEDAPEDAPDQQRGWHQRGTEEADLLGEGDRIDLLFGSAGPRLGLM